MDERSVVCFGDSNTWGYDPRDPLGGRYEKAWWEFLKERTHRQVYGRGANGRCVPQEEWEYRQIDRALSRGRTLLLMLGTNDILRGKEPGETGKAMERLLCYIQNTSPRTKVILLSPPELKVAGFEASRDRLTGIIQQIAQRREIPFLELRGLPLSFDGVHLTEEGHRLLAEQTAELLERVD